MMRPTSRLFIPHEHLRNMSAGPWRLLYDEEGLPLVGIRGQEGAVAMSAAGQEIGVDLLELQPGAAFPLHTHPGDHILYILEGPGRVRIDGVDYTVIRGDSIFIPAEFPHAVQTCPEATGPLLIVAFGHPHKHLTASDRMHVLDDAPLHLAGPFGA